MEPINIGVIGLGNMGLLHSEWLKRSDRFRLIAVADVDEERTASVAEEGIRAFSSGSTLLRSKAMRSSLEAVLIATPHYDHTVLGIKALNLGFNVLIEKPISVDKRDAERLLAAFTGTDLVFGAMFNQRVHPAYRYLKEVLQAETFGALRRFSWTITDWFRSQRYFDSGGWRATWSGEGGGVLLNQAPHQLDLLTWLFGSPNAVFAECGFGRWHNIDVEDEVHAVLKYDQGVTGSFITSTGEAPGHNILDVVCDRATLTFEMGAPLRIQRNALSITESIENNRPFEKPAVKIEEISFEGDGGQHRTILDNFAQAVRGEEPLIAPGVEGISSVELANAMLLSGGSGQVVQLPLDAGRYRRWLNGQKRSEKQSLRKGKNPHGGSVTDLSGSFGT